MEEDGCKQNDKQTSLRKTEKNWVTNEKEEIGQNNKFDLFDSAGNNNDKLWIKLKLQTTVATFEYSKPEIKIWFQMNWRREAAFYKKHSKLVLQKRTEPVFHCLGLCNDETQR